jgi:hypothetical protein
LESLNSNELEKLENTLGSNKSQIEFQSCLILHLKINQMKIEGKSKDEIQNAKIKSALLLGLCQNVSNKSLLGQCSKMIQISFLIAFVSALKRDLNEIEKNEYILPLINKTLLLKIMTMFNSCFEFQPLSLMLNEIFSKVKEIE